MNMVIRDLPPGKPLRKPRTQKGPRKPRDPPKPNWWMRTKERRYAVWFLLLWTLMRFSLYELLILRKFPKEKQLFAVLKKRFPNVIKEYKEEHGGKEPTPHAVWMRMWIKFYKYNKNKSGGNLSGEFPLVGQKHRDEYIRAEHEFKQKGWL